MQYKKYKNQAGINLTPPPPSQNSLAVEWQRTAESERRVAEIKKTDFSVVARLISKLATEFQKEDATRRIDWTQ